MANRTFVARAIDEVISMGPHPMLKSKGFLKKGRSFWRRGNGVYQVVNFQGSQWNSADDGKFTINLGVSQPFFHKTYCGTPLPKTEALAYPFIHQRIGLLMPEKTDVWFVVNMLSNQGETAKEITRLLEQYGLPWLERMGDVDQLISMFDVGEYPVALQGGKLAHAILLAFKGNKKRAAKMFAEVSNSAWGHEFADHVSGIAKRLNL